VWTLAVVALLALPLVQLVAPPLPLVAFDAARLTTPPHPARAPSREAGARASGAHAALPSLTRGAATLVGGLPASGTPSGAPVPASAWSPAASSATIAGALAWIWALGAAFVLGSFFAGRLALARLARGGRPVEDASWHALASEVAASLGVGRAFRLLVTPETATPMTWGTWRPVLLLPETASSWSLAQRRAFLVHELAHLARFDCAIQQLAQIACALYWFHPGAWYAAHRLRVEREQACDDRVLADGARASDYATQLLDAVRSGRGASRLVSASSAAMAAPSSLHQRVRALLDARADRRALTRRGMVASGAVALALVTFVASLAPKAPPAAQAGEAPREGETIGKNTGPGGLAGRWDRSIEEAKKPYGDTGYWIAYAIAPGATAAFDEALISDSDGWRPKDLTRGGESLAEQLGCRPDDAVFLFRFPKGGGAERPGFDRVAIRTARFVPDLGGLPLVSLHRADVDESLSLIDRLLDQTGPDARARVLVTAMALHDTPRALVSLQSMLNGQREEDTRAQAGEGLARHPTQRSIDVLVEHAKSDASTKVSRECAEALGDLDLPQATEELIHLAFDLEDATVRQEAVEALGEKDPGRVIATLMIVSEKDPNESVRREAVETLGDLSGDEGIMALKRLASKSKDPQVRSEAQDTLEEIAQRRHGGGGSAKGN
jgi:beta-lactamase regulating signal transducer with metallopeptidase domain